MLNETLEAEREYQKTLIEEYDRGYKKGFMDAKLEQQEQQWVPCMPTTMPDTDEELWSDYVLVTRRGYYPNGEE